MAWEARHVLLGRARVKARSLAERAIGNPFGKLHREVGDGKPAVLGFEVGSGCSEPCCVHGPSVPKKPSWAIPRACFRAGVVLSDILSLRRGFRLAAEAAPHLEQSPLAGVSASPRRAQPARRAGLRSWPRQLPAGPVSPSGRWGVCWDGPRLLLAQGPERGGGETISGAYGAQVPQGCELPGCCRTGSVSPDPSLALGWELSRRRPPASALSPRRAERRSPSLCSSGEGLGLRAALRLRVGACIREQVSSLLSGSPASRPLGGGCSDGEQVL